MKIFYLFILCFFTFGASATTIIVTNTSNSGSNSLRQAVLDASVSDTIRFDPSLLSGGSATLTLTSEIVFSKSLVIKGVYNSSDTLYISGGNTNRHFNISNAGNVTLDSMFLVNGNAGIASGSTGFE